MHKFIRFFLTGLSTYILSLGGTYILIEQLGWTYAYAYSLVLVMITLVNFCMALTLVFRNIYEHAIVGRYALVICFVSLLNYMLTLLFTQLLGSIYIYWIIFFVTGGLFIGKFFIYKKFVFTQSH